MFSVCEGLQSLVLASHVMHTLIRPKTETDRQVDRQIYTNENITSSQVRTKAAITVYLDTHQSYCL